MKRKILPILILSTLIIPVFTLAAMPTSQEDLAGILCNIAKLMFYLLIAVATIFMIASAITFVVAGGDPEKVKRARQEIIAAMAGILIAFLAFGFPYILAAAMGVDKNVLPTACAL